MFLHLFEKASKVYKMGRIKADKIDFLSKYLNAVLMNTKCLFVQKLLHYLHTKTITVSKSPLFLSLRENFMNSCYWEAPKEAVWPIACTVFLFSLKAKSI
ncbi:unnamed protein product, partial [Meganyctiphanes norvegica]